MNLIAASNQLGTLLCGPCIEREESSGTDLSTWVALSDMEIADQAQALFAAILPDVGEIVPDMVSIDPRVVAQFLALPTCETCGRALARLL